MDAKITHVAGRATLEVQVPQLPEHVLQTRFEELLPVLLAALSADIAWHDLLEEERFGKLDTWLALDLMYQASLEGAFRRAKDIEEVLTGSKSPSLCGFPELEELYQDDA